MSHNESIHSIVFSSSCPDIVKRTSISSVFTSLGMLFTGVLAIAATFSFEDKSSTTSMALMVLGTALLLVSIFRLFWKSKQVVYLPTGSSTREFSAYFDLTYLNSLQELLTSGSVPSSSHFQMVESGNIRMDVLYSSDEKFAAVQLFQFIPYKYEPVTMVNYFKNADAQAFISFIKSKNV